MFEAYVSVLIFFFRWLPHTNSLLTTGKQFLNTSRRLEPGQDVVLV